jgi:hypothetical protein
LNWVGGGCHCGAVRFEVDPGDAPELLDCNCSICAKSGFVHLIVPDDRFRLLAGEGALTAYQFGTGAARHLFCASCGVKSFYKPRSHPEGWSINARCLDVGLDAPVHAFDGRNWEDARAALG